MRFLFLMVLGAGTVAAQSATDISRSVSRALPILQRSAATFVEKRACVSCHHNMLPPLAFHMARERGFAIDQKVIDAVEEKTLRSLRTPTALDDAIQATTLSDPTPGDSFVLMAAHAAGVQPDLTTGVYARRLARWQRDGHWVTSDFRPPHSSSVFTATASAVRAIQLYMPAELRDEREACLQRARQWLVATQPASTEDAAFRVMGLVWAGAPETEVAVARRDLLRLQKAGGGWGQLPRYAGDAYSTGEALYALREAGMTPGDAPWRAGVKFLISTEAADGTWRVHTRMLSPADVSPKYFTTGFPYEKDEYLSYAGSVWAVMAMLSALPPKASAATVASPSTASAPEWIRTALFGTAGQLGALLAGGLDANSKTANGTTLLMMAAHDADKVRLLVGRGVDVKARTASGVDALTVASAYRDSAGSVQALLDAGAEVKAPEGVRVKNTPLLLASMAGDLANVKLLLAHGAEPGAGLAQAVTFGYPEVVRALIGAGARATLTESSGINLLHWATITNRADVIPVLAEAKVPLNAIDDAGFTPIMYASTIDFGDAGVLKALLKAGADPKIRNDDKRTALEQARHFGHRELAAALK